MTSYLKIIKSSFMKRKYENIEETLENNSSLLTLPTSSIISITSTKILSIPNKRRTLDSSFKFNSCTSSNSFSSNSSPSTSPIIPNSSSYSFSSSCSSSKKKRNWDSCNSESNLNGYQKNINTENILEEKEEEPKKNKPRINNKKLCGKRKRITESKESKESENADNSVSSEKIKGEISTSDTEIMKRQCQHRVPSYMVKQVMDLFSSVMDKINNKTNEVLNSILPSFSSSYSSLNCRLEANQEQNWNGFFKEDEDQNKINNLSSCCSSKERLNRLLDYAE